MFYQYSTQTKQRLLQVWSMRGYRDNIFQYELRVAISNHADDNVQTKMSENEKGTELRQVKSA